MIRRYRPDDREAVLQIHFDTWLLGGSASSVADDRSRFDRMLIGYLDEFPDLAFVAEDDGEVVGYCLGAPQKVEVTRSHAMRLLRDVLRLPFLTSADRRLVLGQLRFLIYAARNNDRDVLSVVADDRAHLHINVLPKARGKGIGSKLLKEHLDAQRAADVKKVFAGTWRTRLNDTASFWERNGFEEVASAETRFWKHLFPHERIRIVIRMRRL